MKHPRALPRVHPKFLLRLSSRGLVKRVQPRGEKAPEHGCGVEYLECRIAPATFVWDGSSSSDWFTASNWTPDGVPGASDTATLNVNSTVSLGLGTSVGNFTQSAGVLTGAGSLAINGDLNWTGGMLELASGISVEGLASRISGTGQKGLNATLTNTGTITFTSTDTAGSIVFGPSNGARPGVINNSGTFNVTSAGDFTVNFPNTAHGIYNSGIWNVSGGAGTSSDVNSVLFNNSGTVNINTATLNLAGGSLGSTTGDFNVASTATLRLGGGNFTFGSSADIAGAGTLSFAAGAIVVGGSYNITGSSSFAGANVTFNSPVTSLGAGPLLLNNPASTVIFNGTVPVLPSLNFSDGSLGGSASLVVSGNLIWTGGRFEGPAGITVSGLGSSISGNAQKGLNTTLNNTGTITFSSPDTAGSIVFGPSSGARPGVINNSGTFNVTSAGDFTFNFSNPAHGIYNSGIWNVSGGVATSSDVNSVLFNNSGTVNVNTGTLNLAGGTLGPTTGDFSVASTATLRFASGSYLFGSTADIVGAGTVNVLGANVSIGGSLSVGAIAINGTLGGSGVITAAGLLTWTGGTMNGTGVTNAEGGLLINGSSVVLDSRTLNIPTGQSATMSGANASLTFANGAHLNNAGAFFVRGSSATGFGNGGGAPSVFDNAGTLTRDTSAAEFNIGVMLVNSGRVIGFSSTLVFSGGFMQTDTGRVLGGQLVNFTAGSVSAAGSITANVSNTGAILSPGATGAAGELVINGNYSQGPGGTLRVGLGGVAAGQSDRLTVNGTASLNGTLDVALLNGFSAPDGQQFDVLGYQASTGTFTGNTGAPGFTREYQATSLILRRVLINYVWDAGGGANTSWFTPANWSPDGVPTEGDTATLNNGSATITLPSAAAVATFTQSAGILTGAGSLSANNFTWTGGTQAGTGTTAVLAGGTFTLSGSALKSLTQRTLGNGGAGAWTGSGNLQLANGAVFKNLGSFDIQNAATVQLLTGGLEPLLSNEGTLQKTGPGTTNFTGVRVENTGTLRLNAGTLSITGATASFVQTAGLTVLSGGGLTTGSELNLAGGDLIGSGTITGNVSNTGTTLRPGGSSSGKLAIAGNYTQAAGGVLAVELGGLSAGTQYDQLSVSGTATLGGSVVASFVNGFAPALGAVFDIVSAGARSGTFGSIGAPNTLGTNYTSTRAQLVSQPPPAAPTLSIGDASLVEGADGTAFILFTVNLSAAASDIVTVQYGTADGTAVAPDDYIAVPPTLLTFNPGELSKNVSIPVIGDSAVEPNETFLVNLSQPTNATIRDGQAQGTILDDDGDPSLTINSVSVLEGESGNLLATFSVTLSRASHLPVSVQYATADGTALAGQDYTGLAQSTLTFPAGEVSQTIVVSVSGDAEVEPTESFTVVLMNPSHAVIADDAGIGTIRNDDFFRGASQSLSFPEPDGDLVTISLSNLGLALENVTIADDGSIESIDLTQLGNVQRAKGAKALNLQIGVKTPTGGLGDGLTKVGLINADGVGLGSVKLQGDLGQIIAGDGSGRAALKTLKVAGDLGPISGGSRLSELRGALGKLLVGGSVLKSSMQIEGKVNVVVINGDLVGDFGSGAALSSFAERGIDRVVAEGSSTPGGVILADGIGSLQIGGSLKGGGIASTKELGAVSIFGDFTGGGIFSQSKIKSVKVIGKLTSEDPAFPATVTARNKLNSLIVNGDVENSRILVGYNKDETPLNADARIGRVLVKGNWAASSLVAGVQDVNLDGFGRNDVVITDDTTPAVVSRIASVTIKGTASGSAAALDDHFGITAQRIGKLSIAGNTISLSTVATDDILLDQKNMDFRVIELA